MTETTRAGCTGLFFQDHRDIQEQCFPWRTSFQLSPRVAPKVTAEGRRGSNTLVPLLPVFGKQTLEVDNLDLANTAFKSPPHLCQLPNHASDDRNATMDEKWGKEKTFQMT